LLVKSVFLFNAAFAMKILDSISRIDLASLVIVLPIQSIYSTLSIMTTVEHKIPEQQNGRDIQVVRIVTAVA
jgi:hypothetical protein